MRKKDFDITGKATGPNATRTFATARRQRNASKRKESVLGDLGVTTRKTIEVPENYFYQVKMAALKRRLKEKQVWAEILNEYFENHPDS